VRIGPREQFRGLIFFFCEVVKMTAIMSLYEPRPRGTVLGERADRRRVREAEHFFRWATAGSMREITYGLKITKVRCRTRRRIKLSRPHGRLAHGDAAL
jgi:hypothetical protein